MGGVHSLDVPRTKLRRRWLAALLSLLLPGLGLIYATRIDTGLRWTAAFLASTIAFSVLEACPASPTLLVITLVLAVFAMVLTVAISVASWQAASRAGHAKLTKWNSWPIYVTAIVLYSGIPNVGSIFSIWDSYEYASESMLPTFVPGDRFLVWAGYYSTHPPQRGDLVVFPHDQAAWVSRVIGLPGDRIALARGQVILNGIPLQRVRLGPFDFYPARNFSLVQEHLPDGIVIQVIGGSGDFVLDTTSEVVVRNDHVFVLADNRVNGIDSREARLGQVPIATLTDRPLFIFWSDDRTRLGQSLEVTRRD